MPVTHHELRWRCSTCKHENRGRFKTCQNCGKAKEGEVFYDPEEGEDPALTDASLIQQATAGPDWQCLFCGSHQRNDKGECANCGSEKGMSSNHTTKWDDGFKNEWSWLGKPSSPKPKRHRPKLTDDDVEEICSDDSDPPQTTYPMIYAAPVEEGRPSRRRTYLLSTALFFGILLLGALIFWVTRAVEVDANVSSVAWAYTVQVEREKTVHEEGFNTPVGAFDVTPMGMRHHHYKQVQDGFKTEPYTERYQCGTTPRSCSRTPRTCSRTPRTCTGGRNGFKTCTGGDEVCTGGNEVCTGGNPKYCTRQLTRQVPKYKDVSVEAMWYSWNVWRWVLDRQVKETGGSEDKPHWPSDTKVALNANLPNGVRGERAIRVESYTVTFADDEGESYTYHPDDLSEFESFRPGNHQLIKVNKLGSVEIVRAQ